jgi:two-component system sensor histidine kinase/response regulator
MKNTPLKTRLIGGFLLIAMVAGSIGMVGIIDLGSMRQAEEKLYRSHTAPLPELAHLSLAFDKQRVALRDFLAAATPDEKAKFENQANSLSEGLDKSAGHFETWQAKTLSFKERAVLTQFTAARKAYAELTREVLAAGKNGRPNVGWAILWGPDYTKVSMQVLSSLEAIQQLEIADARSAIDGNSALASQSSRTMTITVLLGVALAIACGVVLTFSITRPVREMVNVLHAVASGDLEQRLPISSDDEIGEMADTMNQTIAKLKESREELVTGEQTFRTLFNAQLDSIMTLDLLTGKWIDVNDEFIQSTGYARDEVIGRRSREFNLFVDQAESQNLADQIRKSGEVRNLEMTFRHKDGNLSPCLVSAKVVNLRGRICCVVFARKIRELKEAQAELIEAREAALAASRAKSEFLSSMSHEIRTPMNAVLGMADLLSETELTRDQLRYLDVMRDNGASLLELINSILELARIESGRMQVEQGEFDLSDLIDKTLASFAIRAHGKGLELVARIAPGVPQHLVGDRLRLRQILVNLLGNALKFTETGEVVLVIEHDPESDQFGGLRFTVTDTGIGIPRDKIDAIFNNFTQVDSSTTRKYGGTGLGLAIVQRLVSLMGGRIWVESEVGRGSRFFFTTSFGLASKTITAKANLLPDLAGLRVLIVDDNATNREIVSEMLVSIGALVDEARSGLEALAAVRSAWNQERPFKMILLDMRMPGMDGLEVATRIRHELQENAPLILMLSSDDLTPQLVRMHEARLDAYLVKPITRRELFEAIAKILAEAKTGAVPVEKVESPKIPPPKSIDMPAARILVAEDSSDNRLLISAYLKNTPCQVEFAENGQIAVEKFIRNRYDLVLMDIQMPIMDGHAATRSIRAWERAHDAPRTSIIALTASALDEEEARTRESGCDAHVAKPVKKAALLGTIKHYVARAPRRTNDERTDATMRAQSRRFA